MCTLIGKETSSKLIVIVNTPCCLFVEDIQSLLPKISRENSWKEIGVGSVGGEMPDWTRFIDYNKLSPYIPHTTGDGKRLISPNH